jgi:hypothetical protein
VTFAFGRPALKPERVHWIDRCFVVTGLQIAARRQQRGFGLTAEPDFGSSD